MDEYENRALWRTILGDSRFWILGIVAILVAILVWAAIRAGLDQLQTPQFKAQTPSNGQVGDLGVGGAFTGGDPETYDGVIDPALPDAPKPAYHLVEPPEPNEVSPQADRITPGETILVTLDAGSFRQWGFEGTANDHLDILLLPYGDAEQNANFVIEIFSPDGSVLTRVDEAGVGKAEIIRGLNLPATGNYSIWVSDDDFTDSGHYTLLVLTEQSRSGYPLRIGTGQKLVSDLPEKGWQTWFFTGSENDAVTIRAIPFSEYDPNLDLTLTITDPFGQVMIEQNRGGRGEEELILGLTLPIAGNYTIWLSDTTFEHAGTFLLELTH